MRKFGPDEKITYYTQKLIERRCDKCGENLHLHDERFEHFEIECRIEIGSSYPDNGNYTYHELTDLCSDCTELLIKVLKDNGFNWQIGEVDW